MSFEIGLRILMDSRPRFELTPNQAVTWKLLLSDVPPESLVVAAVLLAREDKWEPSPAEWRKRALEVAGRGATSRLTAAEAWDEMRRNRKRYSPTERNQNHKITWSSIAVLRAAEAVGWTDLTWELEDLPTIRAQFERYYNSLSEKAATIERTSEVLAELPGIKALLDRTNARRLT